MDVQAGVSYIFNGLTNENYSTRLPVKQDCYSHDSFDDIIEMHNARAQTTTLADVCTIARSQLGDEAKVFLGYNLVVSLRCKHCDSQEALLTPHFKLTERKSLCPVCGELRIPDVMSAFSGEEQYALRPLNSLGVAPLSVLAAYNGNMSIGIELTGDLDEFLSFR
jgi:adenylyltransferase/sulfurtransferase